MDESTNQHWTSEPLHRANGRQAQPESGSRPKAVLVKHGVDELVCDLPDPAVVASASRRIVVANDAAETLFASPPGDLIGRHLDELVCSSEEQGTLSQTPQGAGQRRSATVPLQFTRLNGSKFRGITLGGPIRDDDGRLAGQLVIFRDLSRTVAFEQALRRLHSITSNRSLCFFERLEAILRLGTEHFNLPMGILSRIEGESYEVIRAVAPESPPQPGTQFQLGQTYCVHTLQALGPTGFHHAGASSIHDHPCYQTFHLEGYLGAPILIDGAPYGTLNFSSPTPTRPFSDQDFELVRLFADWVAHEIERHHALKRIEDAQIALEEQASTDHLTKVLNRRALTKRLEHEISRSLRYGHPLSVVLVDLDHFKKINDTHGHNVGDEMLKAFAQACGETVRDVDAVGRWGGEEFLLVLPATTSDQAALCAERLRCAAEEIEVEADGETARVTISAGIGDLRGGLTLGSLILCADQALYRAKELGRNRFCSHHSAD